MANEQPAPVSEMPIVIEDEVECGEGASCGNLPLITRLDQQLALWIDRASAAERHLREAQEQNAKLVAENERLKAWQNQALAYESTVPGLEDKLKETQARVRELEAANTRLRTSWREDVAEERVKVEQLEAQLTRLQQLCARRPALDKPTLYENVAHAIAVAGQKTDECVRLERRAEAAEAKLAALTAQQETKNDHEKGFGADSRFEQ
jgi:chromosome segregation ATPase